MEEGGGTRAGGLSSRPPVSVLGTRRGCPAAPGMDFVAVLLRMKPRICFWKKNVGDAGSVAWLEPQERSACLPDAQRTRTRCA